MLIAIIQVVFLQNCLTMLNTFSTIARILTEWPTKSREAFGDISSVETYELSRCSWQHMGKG